MGSCVKKKVPPIQSRCEKPQESQSTDEQLAMDLEEVPGQKEEDEQEIDVPVMSPWKDLIRKILKAKATNQMVRLDDQQCATVLHNGSNFLKKLHRNEMKHSNKQVKLFFVCEACHFRTEIRDEVHAHLAIGPCVEGFYMALGFRSLKVYWWRRLECEMCEYRTENSNQMRVHQQKCNHSGIRRTKIAKQVALREYPCEGCGKVFASFGNRRQHRTVCSWVAAKANSKVDAREAPCDEDQPQASEGTASKGDTREQEQEPLVTVVKIEENNPLEAIKYQEQESKETEQSPRGRKLQTCMICNYKTNQKCNLNRHMKHCLRKHPAWLQRLFKCPQCQESFSNGKQLAAHTELGQCQAQEMEIDSAHIPLPPRWQGLIRRILKAEATNGLARLTEQEYQTVQKRQTALLKLLNRKELIHLSKRVKLFYVCEACSFRSEVRDEVLTHLKVAGTCGQGFYKAFGFRVLRNACMRIFECVMCDFRTEKSDIIKDHQQKCHHDGIRATKATKQVAARDYPCEYCGRVFTTFANRKRHRLTKCSRSFNKRKTISSEAKDALSYEDSAMNDQSQASEDTASKGEDWEEQPEPLFTEVKIEENDPLEEINQTGSQQEQETAEVKQPMLKCTICNYITLKRGNLNRHIITCLAKSSSIESTGKQKPLYDCTECPESFFTEKLLATHTRDCHEPQEEEDEDATFDDAPFNPLQQDLFRRVLDAKPSDGLVRLNDQEYDTVLESKQAFLKQLQQNELKKNSNKRVKLFYVCEACHFRTEIRDEVLTHLNVGTCLQGFYKALGFRAVHLRSVRIYKCDMCDFVSKVTTGNMHRHQRTFNHSGISWTRTKKLMHEREYPCEYCGKVFTTSNNRMRHQRTCPHAAGKIVIIDGVTVYDQSQALDDTAAAEQAAKPLATAACKTEKDDLRSEVEPKEPERPTRKARRSRAKKGTSNRTWLQCDNCTYTSPYRGNMNRHEAKCSANVPPVQSTYFGSSDSE